MPYCRDCGTEVGQDRFCAGCGAEQPVGHAVIHSESNSPNTRKIGVAEGVKIGFGMFIVLPVLLLGGCVVLIGLIGTGSPTPTNTPSKPPTQQTPTETKGVQTAVTKTSGTANAPAQKDSISTAQSGPKETGNESASKRDTQYVVRASIADAVIIAGDAKTHALWMEQARLGNQAAIMDLTLQGRVATLDSGTEIEILSRGPTTSKVKVLEGPWQGTTGFVSTKEILKKAR